MQKVHFNLKPLFRAYEGHNVDANIAMKHIIYIIIPQFLKYWCIALPCASYIVSYPTVLATASSSALFAKKWNSQKGVFGEAYSRRHS